MAADDKGNIGYWHPGPAAARPAQLRRAAAAARHRRGRVARLPARRASARRWSTRSRATCSTGTTCRRPTGPTATARRASARPARSTARPGSPGRSRRRTARAAASSARSGSTSTSGRSPSSGRSSQSRLKRVRKSSTGTAADLLDVILKWNGSYVKVDAARHRRPGRRRLGAVQDERQACRARALGDGGRRSSRAARRSSHQFDITNLEAFALRTLTRPRLPAGGEARARGADQAVRVERPGEVARAAAGLRAVGAGCGVVPGAVLLLRSRDVRAQQRARALTTGQRTTDSGNGRGRSLG